MTKIKTNRQANFNYQILETCQAGLALTGPEVKSVKNNLVSLKGSYVAIDKKNEVWLINCYISPYPPAQNSQKNYEPTRPKKLLLKKSEIQHLIGKLSQQGLTIIPTSLYTKKGLIKLDIALAKGKSRIDKRETIRKREAQREINRTLKH